MQNTLFHNKGKKLNIMVESMGQKRLSHDLTPTEVINKELKSLNRLKKDCLKPNTIYITKSSYHSLQIALAFCFSKSLNKNPGKVTEIMSILSDDHEALSSNQIIPIIDGLIEYIKQGKENYDLEEALYLFRYLSPLLYLVQKKRGSAY